MKSHPVFAIGEIVKIVNDDQLNPATGENTCIVEEVIIDPRMDHSDRGGLFSLYGWEQPNPYGKSSSPSIADGKPYGSHPSDWYFGDYAGSDLETSGKIATAEEILEWAETKSMIGGYFKDVQWIVANIGKSEKTNRRSGVKML